MLLSVTKTSLYILTLSYHTRLILKLLKKDSNKSKHTTTTLYLTQSCVWLEVVGSRRIFVTASWYEGPVRQQWPRRRKWQVRLAAPSFGDATLRDAYDHDRRRQVKVCSACCNAGYTRPVVTTALRNKVSKHNYNANTSIINKLV